MDMKIALHSISLDVENYKKRMTLEINFALFLEKSPENCCFWSRLCSQCIVLLAASLA